jgi:hypothetical protein
MPNVEKKQPQEDPSAKLTDTIEKLANKITSLELNTKAQFDEQIKQELAKHQVLLYLDCNLENT